MAGVRKTLVLILALVALFIACASHAQEIEISSDTLTSRGPVLELEGSVVVKRGEATVKADRAVYNTDTGDITAEGNIRYEDPDAVITAERTEVNLQTRRGVLYGATAYFKEDQYRFTGSEIRKTGPNRYTIREGSATTCEGLPPAWCFRGSDIDVRLGERVKAKRVVFRIKGVPVFYTPYLWAPIVTERRTGLLSPTIGFRDSTGLYYRQPFFWAISPNRDATLFLDYYSRRAFAEGLEYRYIEGPATRGNLNLYHLRDSRREKDYFEARAEHRQDSRYVKGFLDLNVVNHDDFYRIYRDRIEESSVRFLESAAEVYAVSGRSRLYLLGRHYRDLKEGVSEETVLQRLPQLGVFYAPDGIGPVLLRAEASATRFEREEGVEGERYGIGLTGTYSIGRGPVLTQTASARQVFYETEDTAPGGGTTEDSIDNQLYEYEAALLTAVGRSYGGSRHTVEVELSYRYAAREGEAPPLFDSTELFGDASVAAATLMSRLADSEGDYLVLRVSQPYDLKAGDEPLLPLEADLAVFRPFRLTAGLAYDQERGRADAARARADVRFRRTGIRAGYDYARDTDVNTFRVDVRQGLGPSLELSAGARYDEAEEGGLEEFSAGLRYSSQCWGVELRVVDRRDDYSVFFNISLLGLGQEGSS